jgi:hypothetical protein
MSKLSEKIKEEFVALIPTVFFFVTLNLVALRRFLEGSRWFRCRQPEAARRNRVAIGAGKMREMFFGQPYRAGF